MSPLTNIFPPRYVAVTRITLPSLWLYLYYSVLSCSGSKPSRFGLIYSALYCYICSVFFILSSLVLSSTLSSMFLSLLFCPRLFFFQPCPLCFCLFYSVLACSVFNPVLYVSGYFTLCSLLLSLTLPSPGMSLLLCPFLF